MSTTGVTPLQPDDASVDARPIMERVDRLRVGSMSRLIEANRSVLGQYFTPSSVAIEMAEMVENPHQPRIRLLDPGAGSGSLSGAVISQVLANPDWGVVAIEVDAYELDESLHPALHETLRYCAERADGLGVEVTWNVIGDDFVAAVARAETLSKYDLVITNPPYKKIAVESETRASATAIGSTVVNLYTAFLVAAVAELKPDGQLVAITPRSFTNGPYHRSFRKYFFERMSFGKIHLYESRALAFLDSDVLQENVIFSATRTTDRPKVVLSINDGPGHPVVERVVAHDDIVAPGDEDKFIHIPIGGDDADVARLMASMPATLPDLAMTVSTGKVVDFRAKEDLRQNPEEGAVPLIYPLHLRNGRVDWPQANARKSNALAVNERTERLLLPNEPYVLVKRFSSKEERRRVNSSVLFPQDLPGDHVAIENHSNVFHRNQRGLEESEAIGLSLYLSSSFVDQYVRQFNGHTQINATDLRRLRYPSPEQLRALGMAGAGTKLADAAEADRLVHDHVISLQEVV